MKSIKELKRKLEETRICVICLKKFLNKGRPSKSGFCHDCRMQIHNDSFIIIRDKFEKAQLQTLKDVLELIDEVLMNFENPEFEGDDEPQNLLDYTLNKIKEELKARITGK